MANDHTLSLKNEKYLARNLSPVCIEMFGDDDHYILLFSIWNEKSLTKQNTNPFTEQNEITNEK